MKLTPEQQEIKDMLDDLCDLEDEELDKWQMDFVENVSHLAIVVLSPRQVGTVRDLHKRFC